MIRARRATSGDSAALRALLLSEEPASPRLIAYDRGEDFFALYRHLGAGPETYWIAESNSQIAGVMAAFPANSRFPISPLFYITDAFVRANERGGRAMMSLTRPIAEEVIREKGAFFALEETREGLAPFATTARRWGLWMKFVGESTLFEFDLSAATPAPSARITKRALKDCGSSFLEHYASQYAKGAALFSPVVDRNQFRALAELDAEAHFLTLESDGEIRAGLLAADLGSVRMMHRTKRALALARMNSQGKVPDPIIKYLQWSLPWGSEADLRLLVTAAGADARVRGFQFAGIRDVNVIAPNLRRHSHRILLGRPVDAPVPDLSGQAFQLDPLFL